MQIQVTYFGYHSQNGILAETLFRVYLNWQKFLNIKKNKMTVKIIPGIKLGEKPEEKQHIDFLVSLNECDLELTNSSIKFMRNKEVVFESKLTEYESDFLTITHVGNMNNGDKFRVVQASEMTREFSKVQEFTIGSYNPIGYAVDFEIIK